MNPLVDCGGLAPKALYTITELMRATGLTRARLYTVLRRADVELMPAGRTVYVPRSELRRKLGPMLESMVDTE